MEGLNQSLFLLLNAGPGASDVAIAAARFLADRLIWLLPAGLVIGWLRGSPATRHVLMAATVSGLAGLLINQLIGVIWYHPRPFEIGVGRVLIEHVRDSSFPSDHLTLIWAVAFRLLWHDQSRRAGWTVAVLGVPVAWARVYLGVHFPLDMLGSALVAVGTTGLALGGEHHWMPSVMRLILPPYRRTFAGLIRRGWVRE